MPATDFTVERDGVTLRGAIDGDGPELLFLHGLNGSASMQRANAPTGYTVAAYDQRGHASSTTRTDAAAYAIGEFAADAIAVLDHLGWERPVIVGTSMGAAIALRLALDHPHRVRALGLEMPAFGDVPNTEIARFDAIADALERVGMARAIAAFQEAQQARGLPAEATAWLDGWRVHDPAALAAAERVVGRWTIPDLEDVRRLACPVAVVCWPDDPMHPQALAERIAALTGGRIARVPSLADGIIHPELVAGAMARVLDAALSA